MIKSSFRYLPVLGVAASLLAGVAMAQAPGGAAGAGTGGAEGPKITIVPPPNPADPGTFPRLDGHPDLTGVWLTNLFDFVPPDRRASPLAAGGGAHAAFAKLLAQIPQPTLPSLTPAYRAKQDAWLAAAKAGHPPDDSVSLCKAFGMVRMMTMYPLEFLQTRNQQLTINLEILHQIRRIYWDGRKVDPDADPSYIGHSIGHWEGDTLVVDTTGLLAADVDIDGTWLSNKAHVTERITMVNKDGIVDQITVNDPKALTKPWTFTINYARAPKGTELEEYICDTSRND